MPAVLPLSAAGSHGPLGIYAVSAPRASQLGETTAGSIRKVWPFSAGQVTAQNGRAPVSLVLPAVGSIARASAEVGGFGFVS